MVNTVTAECTSSLNVMPETHKALKKYCYDNGLKICYGADALLQQILEQYGYIVEKEEK